MVEQSGHVVRRHVASDSIPSTVESARYNSTMGAHRRGSNDIPKQHFTRTHGLKVLLRTAYQEKSMNQYQTQKSLNCENVTL